VQRETTNRENIVKNYYASYNEILNKLSRLREILSEDKQTDISFSYSNFVLFHHLIKYFEIQKIDFKGEKTLDR